METCSMLLCGLLIASGVLSSQTQGTKEFGKGTLDGLSVDLSAGFSEILAGNVTLYFHIPKNFSSLSSQRTLSVIVYDNRTNRRLHTERVPLDSFKFAVILPCEVFDHPGLYKFKYRVSHNESTEYAAFIPQTLSLKRDRVFIDSPTNHTALTRFGIWIRHRRKCLPKTYRDRINLYYEKGHKKIFVTRKYVRKLANGKQKFPQETWLKMGFTCDVFDTQGSYRFEYQAGIANLTLAKSEVVYVNWGHRTLSSHTNKIFPCSNAFTVSFTRPECPYARTNDVISVREKNSDKSIMQKPVEQDHTATFFPCTLFKHYVEEYCFDYVTDSSLTRSKIKVASMCLPTHPPGNQHHVGWSSWSPWGWCSSSCGKGTQHRFRYCLSVSTTQDKESSCEGNSLMSRSCAPSPCPVSCSCGCILKKPQGMITSSPQILPSLGPSKCKWVINLPEGSRVRLWFDALKMNGDSIIIRDGKDVNAPQIVVIKDDKYKEPIISTGNNLYIYYEHNGIWTNGTRRGFTASYRTERSEENKVNARGLSRPRTQKGEPTPTPIPYKRKTLGKKEVTFLVVFIFAVLVIGILLFIVFTKLRHHHERRPPPSSGSSSTSESTLRSTGTSSPLDYEISSSEPLKGCQNQRVRKDKSRSSHRKKTRRTEFLCDADRVPRCTCGEISELDSASGNNSASDCSPVRVINNVERVLVRDNGSCDCPDCLGIDRYPVEVCQEFRAPEKKYYGDWMLTEMPQQTSFHSEQRIYRDSCKSFV